MCDVCHDVRILFGRSIWGDLTSASNFAGCRSGKAINSYPVFRGGSVNCVTYLRKLSEKLFVLENFSKNFSDARAQASKKRRFTWALTTGECEDDFRTVPGCLPRRSEGLNTDTLPPNG
jgi:hypothetical protein